MALGYQNPFYLKQAQQKEQSLYNGKVLLEKHDPLSVCDSEETLELAHESRLKMKQLNKEIKGILYTKVTKVCVARCRTSWTQRNPGRRFLGCPNYLDSLLNCNFFRWVDRPLSNRWYEDRMYENHVMAMEAQAQIL
ncbi:gag-pol polyprotein [Tanacetum coccineum]